MVLTSIVIGLQTLNESIALATIFIQQFKLLKSVTYRNVQSTGIVNFEFLRVGNLLYNGQQPQSICYILPSLFNVQLCFADSFCSITNQFSTQPFLCSDCISGSKEDQILTSGHVRNATKEVACLVHIDLDKQVVVPRGAAQEKLHADGLIGRIQLCSNMTDFKWNNKYRQYFRTTFQCQQPISNENHDIRLLICVKSSLASSAVSTVINIVTGDESSFVVQLQTTEGLGLHTIIMLFIP